MNQKLILFDIDGTLIYHVGKRHWNEQYTHGMKVAYGIKEPQQYDGYNGFIEMHMAWDIVQKYGFDRQEFLKRFPAYVVAMREHLDQWAKSGPVFEVIDEAVVLVEKLAKQNAHVLGVLTGNAKSIAQWKLSHVGLSRYFSFGLYGEEADNRVALAKLVFEKTKKELHQVFAARDIVVIGDTVHDIRCGKAIGATVIAVTTGMHGNAHVLRDEHPDLLVDTLADTKVYEVLLNV